MGLSSRGRHVTRFRRKLKNLQVSKILQVGKIVRNCLVMLNFNPSINQSKQTAL